MHHSSSLARLDARRMRRETRARKSTICSRNSRTISRDARRPGAISSVGLVVVLALLSQQCADTPSETTTTYDLAVDDDGGGREQHMRINVDVTPSSDALRAGELGRDGRDGEVEAEACRPPRGAHKTRVDARGW